MTKLITVKNYKFYPKLPCTLWSPFSPATFTSLHLSLFTPKLYNN